MAAGERRTEVLDSEDEPMTSSPVEVSDGAADKLCAEAPVSLQDTQDALQDAARTHQANAESAAKPPAHRAGGLEADQENASTNDVAPIDMQPAGEAVTPTEDVVVEAHHSDVTPSLPRNSSQAIAQVANATSQPVAVTARIKSEAQGEIEQAMTEGPIDANDPSTDLMLPTPEGASHGGAADTETDPSPEVVAVPPTLDRAGVSTDDSKPEGSSLAGSEEQASTQGAVDGCLGQDQVVVEYDELKPSWSSALPDADSTPEDSPMEVAVPEDVGSSSKDVTDTNYSQNAARETATHVTEHSTSQAPAQSSVSGCAAEQPTTTVKAPSLLSRDGNENVDIEMTGVSQREDDPKPINTAFVTSPDEPTAPTNSAPANIAESASPPASIPATGNAVLPPSESDVHGSESHSRTQTNPGQTEVGTSEATEGANSVSDTAVTSQPSAVVPTAPELEPNTAQADTAKGADLEGPPSAKTPQEITLDELKAQKAALLASLAALPAIRILMEETADASDGDDEPTEKDVMAAANKIVKDHIKLLHEYNELKDVGQGLMGLIADQRGVRIVEVQEEFGVDAKD